MLSGSFTTQPGYADGLVKDALFAHLQGVCWAPGSAEGGEGLLYVVDSGNAVVRQIDLDRGEQWARGGLSL